MNLFVVAMKEEIKFDLDSLEKKVINNSEVFVLNKKNYLLVTDVSKENAIFHLTNVLSSNKSFQNVFNIGTAGSAISNNTWFDIVIGDKIQFLDVDFTVFNYDRNEIPRFGKNIQCNLDNLHKIETILKNKLEKIKIGNIGTSDSFIHKGNFHKFSDLKNVECFDMESAGLAFVASKLDINFNSIKVLSDNLFSNKSNEDFYQNLSQCSLILAEILKLIMENF